MRSPRLMTVTGLFLGPLGVAANAGETLIADTLLPQAGLVRFWDADLPLAKGDTVQAGYLVDDTLFVVTEGGTLFSIEAGTGLIRWGEKVSARNYVIFRPTHDGSGDATRRVVIATSEGLEIRDRFSGELLSRVKPEFTISAPPAAEDDRLFLGALDGRVRAVRWSSSQAPVTLWSVQTGGAIKARPLYLSDQILLFASGDGRVYCCDPGDKRLRWSFATSGPIVADPAVGGGSAFVAGMDRLLYKLDLRNGKLAWRLRTPSPLRTAPVAAGDTVFQFVDENEGLLAVDVESGRERWRLAEGRTLCARTRDFDVVHRLDNRLAVVAHDTGEPAATLEVSGPAVAVVNGADDALYLLGRDGRVLCARVDRIPYLRQQQVMAAWERLNVAPPEIEPAPKQSPDRAESLPDVKPEDVLRSRRDTPP